MDNEIKDHNLESLFHVEYLGDWKSERSSKTKNRGTFHFVEAYGKKTGPGSIIKSGIKNQHPKFLKDLLGSSGLHKTLVQTKATLAMGDDINVIVQEDAPPDEAQKAYAFLKKHGLIKMREGLAMDIGTYGGFCVQKAYDDDVVKEGSGTRKLVKAHKHDFDEFRLMKPTRSKYGIYKPEYASLHSHWGNKYKQKDVITLPIWFPETTPDGELTEESKEFKLDADILGVEEKDLVEYQNRFFYYGRVYTNEAKYYPVPDYQSSATLDAIVLDSELIHFDVNEIDNGLSIGYIITIFRKNWSIEDPDKEKRLREAENKLVSQKMVGAKNKGKVTIMRAQPSPDGNNKGNVNIQPIPNNNNAERHIVLEKRKNIYILVGHGITAPEIGGVPDLTKGGFSSDAEKIVVAMESLFFTRLNKWRSVMYEFYESILLEEGFKIKGVKFIDNIPFRKKISDVILKYSYTKDEIRAFNGDAPLTEDKRETLNREIAGTNGTQTSLDL
jgi:hypothetical protein